MTERDFPMSWWEEVSAVTCENMKLELLMGERVFPHSPKDIDDAKIEI